MKEKFERNSQHANIGKIGKNETLDEKIIKLKDAKNKITNAIIDDEIKKILVGNIDEMLTSIESKNTHHR